MCQCKSGKVLKLINLDSTDHLKMAFDVYENYIKDKPTDFEFDDIDKNIMVQTFLSIYPNVKTPITAEHAKQTIINIYNQYYGK